MIHPSERICTITCATALAASMLLMPQSVPSALANSQAGIASYYGPEFQGRRTASGERFNTRDMTAAHRTAPFGTRLKVTSLQTGRSVVVRVNDRGPFVRGRIIDLSGEAASRLGMKGKGLTRVRVERL